MRRDGESDELSTRPTSEAVYTTLSPLSVGLNEVFFSAAPDVYMLPSSNPGPALSKFVTESTGAVSMLDVKCVVIVDGAMSCGKKGASMMMPTVTKVGSGKGDSGVGMASNILRENRIWAPLFPTPDSA